jgi:hypothetical protein
MAPTFGRILRITAGQPLTVPIYVPPSWAKEPITVELADSTSIPLASTLSGRGAFIAPNIATRTFMARDVQLHVTDGMRLYLVARCPLGAVSEPVTTTIG